MFLKSVKGKLKVSNDQVTVEINSPDVVALVRNVKSSLSSSTEITLDVLTKFVQVYAISKDVYLKWGTSDVSSSNFDEVIPAGQVKNFLVPNGVTALNIIEREASATAIVIEK